ncbi:MAG: serine/threonine protein kinase [Candidatus Xenobia bacterium]
MRRELVLLLAAWLLISAAALAAPAPTCTILIRCEPRQSQVMLRQMDGTDELLGQTDGPLRVPFEHPVVTLRIVKDGYFPQEISLNQYFIRDGYRYPRPIRLAPQSMWVQLRDSLAGWGLALGGGFVVLLLATILVVRPRLRRLQERLQQGARLEELVASDETMDHMCGRRLGKFRVAGRVGEGGFAVVYRAVPNDTLRKEDSVAIKVMKKDTFAEPELRARFRREVMILRELNHQSIARIMDWGEQKGLLYLVVELVRGETLRHCMTPGGMPLKKALPILQQVFAAVAYIHKKNVVHRNLKPENIVVTGGEKVKVIDFGLARGQQSVRLTRAGVVLGTPAYMAPEQIKGQAMDCSVDQYALSIIVFELLTGRTPFKASNRMTLMYMQISERPPLMSALNPQIPAPLDEVVCRMMLKDPGERFPSLEEAWQAFEAAAKTAV